MSSQDSLPGRQIDEYQIESLLGAGGMARVYRALDTRLNRYVALKVIAPDFRTDADYAQRFEREAQSIARLDHPNIVHIYRFGESSGLYYMAMEYVEGADIGWLIADYKKDGEVMPLDSVAGILRDIGAALDYAHSKQVIHRDVKPGNVILDKQGRAVLTDFGLALLSDVGTRGEIFGSPHYISPEQAISSSAVGPQSDQYSLGVMLFEMLTGELPFPGEDPMDVAMQHVSEPPPVPSSLNSAIPTSVDQVVLKALSKEPTDRFATCAALSIVFSRALAAPPVLPEMSDTGSTRRPSLVSIPDKVREELSAHPLPPVPPAAMRQEPSFVREQEEVTRPAAPITANATIPNVPARPVPQPDYQVTASRPILLPYPAVLGVAALAVVLICVLVAVFASKNGNNSVVSAPTLTALTVTTLPPTSAPVTLSLDLNATAISLGATQTSIMLPTPTALILSSTQANSVIPTFTPVDTLAPPAAVTPIPPTSALQVIRASANTLVFRRDSDQKWIAFVNISQNPLSLDEFRLVQKNQTIDAAAWQHPILQPGECLRIVADKVPSEAPKGCFHVIELPGNKKDREQWVKEKTTVFINSTTQFCYPTNKCG